MPSRDRARHCGEGRTGSRMRPVGRGLPRRDRQRDPGSGGLVSSRSVCNRLGGAKGSGWARMILWGWVTCVGSLSCCLRLCSFRSEQPFWGDSCLHQPGRLSWGDQRRQRHQRSLRAGLNPRERAGLRTTGKRRSRATDPMSRSSQQGLVWRTAWPGRAEVNPPMESSSVPGCRSCCWDSSQSAPSIGGGGRMTSWTTTAWMPSRPPRSPTSS